MSFYLQSNVGYLDPANKHCIDWNSSGLFAYANNYTINVVDSFSMKIVQTLESNKVPINNLKWSEANIYENQLIKPVFKLATADDYGTILIWNTFESKLVNELVESSNSTFSSFRILDLKWKQLPNKKEILVALYSLNKLIIWDPQFGIKLWTKVFTSSVTRFSIDPHIDGRIACLGKNHVELILNCFDENVKEKPSEKIPIATTKNVDDSKAIPPEDKNFFNKYIKGETSDNKQKLNSQQNLNSQCLQIEFHAIYTNILIIVNSREILFYDLVISKLVGGIQLDKNQSNFQQLYTSSQKNVLIILHDNGCITIRQKEKNSNHKIFSSQSEPIGNDFKKIEAKLNYHLIAQSDQIRLSKNTKVFGLSICPTTQNNITLLLNDGRVLKFEIRKKKPISNKSDLIKRRQASKNLFLLETLDEADNKTDKKVILTKMINNSTSKPFVLKMCPPLTRKNSKYWQPLLAIGCSTGNLVIYNILKNYTGKKITILNNNMAISGIEWISMFNVITWSYHANFYNMDTSYVSLGEAPQQLVRNDIYLTDLRTGESRKLREGQGEESPILKIKLSNLKQYLVILFKEQPFEIWDLKTFSLIKKVSKKSPTINILEWCSIDLKKTDTKPDKSPLIVDLNNEKSHLTNKLTNPANANSQNENFICIDNNGLMYSFSVEQNIIKDGGKVLPEDGLLSNVTSIAIKRDLIVFGDVDGNISVWNTKLKSSKVIPSKHGQIRKLKFAPGKENFLLLVCFNDRIKVFEMKTQELISSFKLSSIKSLEILDCDWCASDKLVISFSNGCLSVFDIFFKRSIDERKFLLSISTNKTTQSLPDFLKNVMSIKRFYYQLIDILIEETNLNFTNLQNTIAYYSNKNETMKDFLDNTHPNLQSLLVSITSSSKEEAMSGTLRKVNAFARLALYLNLCHFEKNFWTYVAYYLDTDKPQDQIFYDLLQQNDFLLNNRDFRQKQYEMFKMRRETNVTNQGTASSKSHSDLLLFNEQNLVFNLLTETDVNSQFYINNCYKACLISSLQNGPIESDSQTNIKLIATNLIINGKVDDGIELLCLIGLILDACRYLQDNDNWEKAAWLAKIRLSDEAYIEVINRWVDHLCTTRINKTEFAILLLLSCQQYAKAIQVLSGTVYTELNYLFLEICIENKMVSVSEKSCVQPSVSEDEYIKKKSCDSNTFNQNRNVIDQKLVDKIKENFKKLN